MPFIYRGGATAEQIASIDLAWSYLDQSLFARPLKDSVIREVVIVEFTNGDTAYDNNSGVLYWNPKRAYQVITEDGTIGVTSPAAAFIHELMHWATPELGDADEIIAKDFERSVARELGEPVRVRGSGVDVVGRVTVDNPTAHTKSGNWVAVDNNLQEFTGPAFDPNNNTLVIGTGDEHTGGVGGPVEHSGGGSGSGSSSGGGATTGGGGGTGVVVVQPVKPPTNDNPQIIFNPTDEMAQNDMGETPDFLINSTGAIVDIEIIGFHGLSY